LRESNEAQGPLASVEAAESEAGSYRSLYDGRSDDEVVPSSQVVSGDEYSDDEDQPAGYGFEVLDLNHSMSFGSEASYPGVSGGSRCHQGPH